MLYLRYEKMLPIISTTQSSLQLFKSSHICQEMFVFRHKHMCVSCWIMFYWPNALARFWHDGSSLGLQQRRKLTSWLKRKARSNQLPRQGDVGEDAEGDEERQKLLTPRLFLNLMGKWVHQQRNQLTVTWRLMSRRCHKKTYAYPRAPKAFQGWWWYGCDPSKGHGWICSLPTGQARSQKAQAGCSQVKSQGTQSPRLHWEPEIPGQGTCKDFTAWEEGWQEWQGHGQGGWQGDQTCSTPIPKVAEVGPWTFGWSQTRFLSLVFCDQTFRGHQSCRAKLWHQHDDPFQLQHVLAYPSCGATSETGWGWVQASHELWWWPLSAHWHPVHGVPFGCSHLNCFRKHIHQFCLKLFEHMLCEFLHQHACGCMCFSPSFWQAS